MKTTAAVAATKFKTLILVDNGILLGYGDKKKKSISFSELDRIYIKSHTLNPVIQFIVILLPFLFVTLADEYLPFDLVVLMVFFMVVPVFMKVYNYKWCQLIVRLKDGTFYRKKVSLDLKSETISVINKVTLECFRYISRQNASDENTQGFLN